MSLGGPCSVNPLKKIHLLGTGKIPAPLRNIVAIIAQRNPIGGRVAFGQLKGDENRIAAGPFDGLALAVGVADSGKPPGFLLLGLSLSGRTGKHTRRNHHCQEQ